MAVSFALPLPSHSRSDQAITAIRWYSRGGRTFTFDPVNYESYCVRRDNRIGKKRGLFSPRTRRWRRRREGHSFSLQVLCTRRVTSLILLFRGIARYRLEVASTRIHDRSRRLNLPRASSRVGRVPEATDARRCADTAASFLRHSGRSHDSKRDFSVGTTADLAVDHTGDPSRCKGAREKKEESFRRRDGAHMREHIRTRVYVRSAGETDLESCGTRVEDDEEESASRAATGRGGRSSPMHEAINLARQIASSLVRSQANC